MDGNRRWARKQGWAIIKGHTKGIDSFKLVVEYCLKKKIPHLSLYAFSLENFKRSEEEKSQLFELALHQSKDLFEQLLTLNVRVKFVGERSLFPASLVSVCQDIETKTAQCTALYLNILFCYGSQQEIIAGVKEVARKVCDGTLREEEINEETFKNYLWLGPIPDPEIIIRTGGSRRLSNFMLYQSAYSEYYFLDCLWPDLTEQDLDGVFNDFLQRKRNFGT